MLNKFKLKKCYSIYCITKQSRTLPTLRCKSFNMDISFHKKGANAPFYEIKCPYLDLIWTSMLVGSRLN